MTLPDAVLWIVALASGVSAMLTRRHTAWPLLASLGLCAVLQWAEVPFDPLRWFLIDVVAMLAICAIGWATHLDRRDGAILALFPLAWIAYALGDPLTFWGGWAVVVTQFLITVPWGNVWGRAIRTLPHNPWDIFDLKVRGEVA